MCGTYFNSSKNAQTFGNGRLDLGAFGHDFQLGDAILFNMQVSIVALPFTADRDSGNNKPLRQSEQNTDHGRRWDEPQHECLADYHLDRLLVCLPQQTHQNLSSLVYMIVFFPHSSLPCLAPAPKRSFALSCFIFSNNGHRLSRKAPSLLKRARGLSRSLLCASPHLLHAPEPKPNQVRVNHNSFGNSVAFTREFSPDSDLKISFRVGLFCFWRYFSFHGKKWPKFSRFWRTTKKNNSKSPDCYDKFH